MPDVPLAELVLDELRVLRRHPSGVTVETLALAPVIRRILGSGDPYLAYTRLQHGLIDTSADRNLRAAAASLGFSTSGDTHLKRLDEAGEELALDQRQVRRLSDLGLVALATLISTNWTVESVPELTAIVTSSEKVYAVAIRTTRPFLVEMSDPEIAVLTGDARQTPDVEWVRSEQNATERALTRTAIVVARGEAETSMPISWRGELWPKFTVHWDGEALAATSESLGNKLMLRFAPRTRE